MKTSRQTKNRQLLRSVVAVPIAAAILPLSALAQSNVALDEITVTAERRTQSSQDVPLAVTTISGDAISPAGISDLSDIALITPNLTITEFNK